MKNAAKLIILLLSPAFVLAAELKPFISDGCSEFPDGTVTQQSLWLNCCISHDLAYWKGGTSEERSEADLALQQCVAAVGEPSISKLMLAGVRVGGSPYYPTPFRWGYGWNYLRGYKPLDEGEKRQVTQQLQSLVQLLNRAIPNTPPSPPLPQQ